MVRPASGARFHTDTQALNGAALDEVVHIRWVCKRFPRSRRQTTTGSFPNFTHFSARQAQKSAKTASSHFSFRRLAAINSAGRPIPAAPLEQLARHRLPRCREGGLFVVQTRGLGFGSYCEYFARRAALAEAPRADGLDLNLAAPRNTGCRWLPHVGNTHPHFAATRTQPRWRALAAAGNLHLALSALGQIPFPNHQS